MKGKAMAIKRTTALLVALLLFVSGSMPVSLAYGDENDNGVFLETEGVGNGVTEDGNGPTAEIPENTEQPGDETGKETEDNNGEDGEGKTPDIDGEEKEEDEEEKKLEEEKKEEEGSGAGGKGNGAQAGFEYDPQPGSPEDVQAIVDAFLEDPENFEMPKWEADVPEEWIPEGFATIQVDVDEETVYFMLVARMPMVPAMMPRIGESVTTKEQLIETIGNIGDSAEQAVIVIGNDIELTEAIVLDSDTNIKFVAADGEVTLYARASRHFVITGGNITLDFSENVILDGGEVAGGIEAKDYGPDDYGVYKYKEIDSDININGVHMTNNFSEFAGGAINLMNVNTVEITNSHFEGNATQVRRGADETELGGGAVHIRYVDRAVLNTCRFEGNESGFSAGGAYIRNATIVTLDDCHFINNIAGANGALTVENEINEITITGGSFVGNQAGENAGAINVAFGVKTILIQDVKILNNTAKNLGGGLVYYTSNTEPFVMNNCIVSGNTAEGNQGGGLYLNNFDEYLAPEEVPGPIEVNSSTIEGNHAGGNGGGIMSKNTFIYINNCEVLNNSTASNGGGVAVESNTDEVKITGDNSRIVGNKAALDGGAVYVPYENVNNVHIEDAVYFDGNTARSFALILKPNTDHETVHIRQISSTATFSRIDPTSDTSERFKYAYNNFDVNYTQDIDRTEKEVRVSYLGNGGTFYAPDENGNLVRKTAHVEIRKAGEQVTDYGVAIRSGYTFLGWFLDSETEEFDFDNYKLIEDTDITLYARWESNGTGGNGGGDEWEGGDGDNGGGTTIVDPEVPLTELPELEEIDDGEVPLGELPTTGGASRVSTKLAISTSAAMIGASLLAALKKRKEF